MLSAACTDDSLSRPGGVFLPHRDLLHNRLSAPTITPRLYDDNQSKAGILNDQFSSVFTREDTDPPSLPESTTPFMQDITIAQEGVMKLLKELDPNKSSGPDNIPAKILKLAAEELAPALTKIYDSP